MLTSLQVNFQLNIFILVHEVHEFLRFQKVTDASGRTTEIAKVEPNIFKLVNSSANHYFILL
jgi:hypothetical protein